MSDFDLLDVLSGRQDRVALELARRDAYKARRAVCPDGRHLEDGQTWCGRCGETVAEYDLTINHDLGYSGCPVEFDPTWKRFPAREDGMGFRGFSRTGRREPLLTVNELCERWDRQYFRDCKCGHAWGIHEDHDRCLAYCGCREYVEKRKYTKRGTR